eukprot:1137055-Pelagomonas_calceolata.AAC.1
MGCKFLRSAIKEEEVPKWHPATGLGLVIFNVPVYGSRSAWSPALGYAFFLQVTVTIFSVASFINVGNSLFGAVRQLLQLLEGREVKLEGCEQGLNKPDEAKLLFQVTPLVADSPWIKMDSKPVLYIMYRYTDLLPLNVSLGTRTLFTSSGRGSASRNPSGPN